MTSLLSQAKEQFADYVQNYDPSNPKIALKIRHTYRVMDCMEELCKSESLNEEETEKAMLCALLHDVGRFEQVRRYGTFVDADSLDHAALSAQIVQEEGYLKSLPEPEARSIVTAIANHNRYAIEEGLDEKTLRLCRLIRDADKIDIFRVFAQEDMEATFSSSLEQIAQMEISPAVKESLMNHQCVNKKDRQNDLDIWMTFLGFFFDLNYPASLLRVLREGYYKVPYEKVTFQKESTRKDVVALLDEIEKYCQSKKEESGLA